LNVISEFSPNGVKNLHPNAHKYDIGIYCESNGHGTFTVNNGKMKVVEDAINHLEEHISTQNSKDV
jgi:phosphoacetylglucosamine mutase